MRAPIAFRSQLATVGQAVLDGDATVEEALRFLTSWTQTNGGPLVHDIVEDWNRRQLTAWLNARSSERRRLPQEQALFDLFGDVPERIEIAPGRFVNLLGARRTDLAAWRRQARVKRANVDAFAEYVERVVAELERRLTDDVETVADALARAEIPAAL